VLVKPFGLRRRFRSGNGEIGIEVATRYQGEPLAPAHANKPQVPGAASVSRRQERDTQQQRWRTRVIQLPGSTLRAAARRIVMSFPTRGE